MHMTLLTLLIAIALPLVSGGAAGTSDGMGHATVMSVENCDQYVAGHLDGGGCGIAMHCMMLVMPDRQRTAQFTAVAGVHQRADGTEPNGIAPEATSPPPRG
tara:strand:+ start:2518 stop:2823 length:306 start_codon:yes stop_codon:yes gene_type:complete